MKVAFILWPLGSGGTVWFRLGINLKLVEFLWSLPLLDFVFFFPCKFIFECVVDLEGWNGNKVVSLLVTSWFELHHVLGGIICKLEAKTKRHHTVPHTTSINTTFIH